MLGEILYDLIRRCKICSRGIFAVAGNAAGIHVCTCSVFHILSPLHQHGLAMPSYFAGAYV